MTAGSLPVKLRLNVAGDPVAVIELRGGGGDAVHFVQLRGGGGDPEGA